MKPIYYRESTKDKSPPILKINWTEFGTNRVVTLLVDNKTRFSLGVNPIDPLLRGSELYEALEKRGAVLQDTIDPSGQHHPADEKFDAETGRRVLLRHCQAGKIQDPANGDPAVQEFDKDTGKLTCLVHAQAGEFHDPASGEAAEQLFDRRTGKRTYQVHYQNGKKQDPVSGEPAKQTFDTRSGLITAAERYTNDERKGTLSIEELLRFNTRIKTGTPSLPSGLLTYQVPGLRPA